MSYRPKDHFFHKAKDLGYVARSAFKLEDLQKKFRLLSPRDRVLDLGSSPGSWSQVAIKIIGKDGQLVGIDLKPTKIQAANARFIEGDILTADFAQFGDKPFDVILSDMAPNTTGIRSRDQALSEELCRMCLQVADQVLRPGGHLVMKIFEGPDAESIVKDMKARFSEVKRFKPEAVRKGSFETYLVGLKKQSARQNRTSDK